MKKTGRKTEPFFVRKARKTYEKSRFFRRHQVRFDTLCKWFKEKGVPYVAKRLGIHTSSASDALNRHCLAACGNKDQFERRRDRQKNRWVEQISKLEEALPTRSVLRLVVQKAREARLEVTLLPRRIGGVGAKHIVPKTRWIALNGKLFSVHVTGTNRIGVTLATNKSVTGHIIVSMQDPPEEPIYIIVPAKVIYGARFDGRRARATFIRIRSDGRHSRKAKLALDPYRDAWWIVNEL